MEQTSAKFLKHRYALNYIHSLYYKYNLRLSCVLSYFLIDASIINLKLPLIFDRVYLGISSLSGKVDTANAIEKISEKEFVFAIALFIGAIAFGLIIAFLIMHVIYIWLSMSFARRLLSAYNSEREFTDNYEEKIKPYLENYSLVCHSWKEFDETLVTPKTLDGHDRSSADSII